MRTHTLPLFSLAALAVLTVSIAAHAAPGPEHRSFRGLAMGNAHVAVVDDHNALYYNPAGLNLINALGNRKARPELADYPRNRLSARVNMIGLALPLQEALEMWRYFEKHGGKFSSDSALRADSANTWSRDLAPFSHRAIEIGVMHGAEFAMHNFGFAYWADVRAAPYPDVGILLPQAGVERIQMDGVIQVAGARGLMNDRLAVGLGYRLANRQLVTDYRISGPEMFEDNGRAARDNALDTLGDRLSNLNDFSTYGHGIDLGVLWQQTSWLRFGAALQNLGMRLNHEYVTPEFTVGTVVTPPLLSSGGVFARKVNLAFDIEDIFSNERNYRPLSKLNFGAEIEQNLIWALKMRVGGGFKGGYWSAGTGITLFHLLHIEAVSWAEEAGYYTGNVEDRYYALNIGVGI